MKIAVMEVDKIWHSFKSNSIVKFPKAPPIITEKIVLSNLSDFKPINIKKELQQILKVKLNCNINLN